MRTTGLLLAAIVLAVCALSAHATDGAGSTVGFEVDVSGKWGNSKYPRREVIPLPENAATVFDVMEKARARNLNENKATRLSVLIQDGKEEEVEGWDYPLPEDLRRFEFRDLDGPGVTGLFDGDEELHRFTTPPELKVRYAGGPDSGELRIKRTDREELSDGAIRVRLEVKWTATPPAGTTPTYSWKSKEGESQAGQQVEFTFKGATGSRCQVKVTAVEGSVLLDESAWTPVCEKRKDGDPTGTDDNQLSSKDKPIQEPKEPSSTGSGGSGAGTPVAPAGQAPPEQTKRSRKTGQSPDGLKEVSGLLIDPSASAAQSAVPEAAPKDSRAGGPAVLGLSGEAATLFGVGLLIALGGLIEARVLVRRP